MAKITPPAAPGSGGSGASVPPKRDAYHTPLGDYLTIVSGEWTNPPWVLDAGKHHDNLLDLTDPTNPTLIVGGYITVDLEVQVRVTHETAAKAIYVELDIDLNGEDANVAGNYSIDPSHDPGGTGINCPLSLSSYCPAGGVVSIAFQHNKGSNAEIRVSQTWLTQWTFDA